MQNKTKIKIFIGIVSAIVVAILANYILSEVIALNGNQIDHVYVRDVLVKAEVVKTETRREIGLAGRSSLPSGRGMLFDFSLPEEEGTRTFWMKGMQFAIDIIWIENGRVIGCERNISPSDPQIFTSPSDAGYVLEVPAGFCDRYSVKVNDAVKI